MPWGVFDAVKNVAPQRRRQGKKKKGKYREAASEFFFERKLAPLVVKIGSRAMFGAGHARSPASRRNVYSLQLLRFTIPRRCSGQGASRRARVVCARVHAMLL